MHILQKTVSYIVLGTLLSPLHSTFASTNKDMIIGTIDSLNSTITTSVAQKEKNLSDQASDLGNRYDSAIAALGFQSDEIEALTSIKSLKVPSFRGEVSEAYADAKNKMLGDIKTVQAGLVGLREEITLGYTDLSSAQKQVYDGKIANIQTAYTAFLTGSEAVINNFTNTFSGSITPRTELVAKMMKENGPYILFIRNIRSGYAHIEEQKASLLKQKIVFETNILPKIQGGFTVFTANKKIFTDAIRTDLVSGLEKALVQERLKKQETELRAYIEDIMSKWNEYMKKNFGQDDEFAGATQDIENALTLEKALYSRVYDSTGNIQSLDISGSGVLLKDVSKVESSLWNVNSLLSGLITTYNTGNVLVTLNDKLLTAYKTELLGYRADFTKLLEAKLNTTLLEEKNHTQTLALLDQEEKILKQNLETVTSVDFSEQLVNNFITKITTLAKNDSLSETVKKVQMLSYRYKKIIVQKKIDDTVLIPYYSKRTSLDSTLNNLFVTLENKSGREALLVKFPIVSGKVDSLLQTKLTPKNRYTLLVVQYNILKYLEDASK